MTQEQYQVIEGNLLEALRQSSESANILNYSVVDSATGTDIKTTYRSPSEIIADLHKLKELKPVQ